jgi:hypothetical protein
MTLASTYPAQDACDSKSQSERTKPAQSRLGPRGLHWTVDNHAGWGMKTGEQQ